MASSNTAMCADPMNCPVHLTTLPTYWPHIPRDTMLCSAITWSLFPHVIQRLKLLEVSVRGRENVAKTTHEFGSSASPVTWHICSWCYILQVTWCLWLLQILHTICPSHEHSSEWDDRHTQGIFKSCATTTRQCLNFKLWTFFISLFWHLGFWNGFRVFGKSVDPIHCVYI